MAEVIIGVVAIFLLLVMIGSAIVGTWASAMSDAEREKWGIGPRGQGR